MMEVKGREKEERKIIKRRREGRREGEIKKEERGEEGKDRE